LNALTDLYGLPPTAITASISPFFSISIEMPLLDIDEVRLEAEPLEYDGCCDEGATIGEGRR